MDECGYRIPQSFTMTPAHPSFSKSMYRRKFISLSFNQYIPSKRHRFGVKFFILCDCKTKYILDFIVYTGTDTEIEKINNLGVARSIVMTQMKPYL